MKPISKQNFLDKYADDMFLIVPSSNENTVTLELNNIEEWCSKSNLKLNYSKSKEIVFFSSHQSLSKHSVVSTPNIPRAHSITVLGVTISEIFSVSNHISLILSKAYQSMYALKNLKLHGIDKHSLHIVANALLLSRVMYAVSAWSSFCISQDRQLIQSCLHKAAKFGYFEKEPDFVELCSIRDSKFFEKITSNPNHVLFQFLPPLRATGMSLRKRNHPYELPQQSVLLSKNFFNRVLFKNCY